MSILFNILVIGMVLLIAYWWANQGLFSALLHLLAVIVAGAVAIGVWEPIVVNFLLTGSGFDNYAWGVTLVGVFAVTLFLARLATDRLARANVDLPTWANLGIGFPVGLLAGILTIGMTLIGCGFIQSSAAIMGYRGYGPDTAGNIVKYGDNQLWLPVQQITAGFYGWLSATSMWTNKPLLHYNPKLHQQSSLVRASYSEGVGQITMPPDGAVVQALYFESDQRHAAVEVRFTADALDFGEQLTLAKAQVRLIGYADRLESAPVAHPDKWVQDGEVFLFDNVTHYITSVPGRESAEVVMIFSLPPGFVPRFIQIKGTRFTLPQPRELPPGLLEGVVASSRERETTTTFAGARPMSGEEIDVSNSVRPIRASKNMLPGGIKADGTDFVEGYATFASRSAGQISRNLQMRGVYEPEGTKIVMVDVSRGAAADLYNQALQDQVGDDGEIRLVDAQGYEYSPIGFIHEKAEGKVDLKLVPGEYLRTFDQLPYLPTTGTERLRLYFRVTAGVTLKGLEYGDVMVATCNVEVPEV